MLAQFATLALAPDDDRSWFLDHGKRHHRLRRDGSGAVVANRSGRSFRLDWPADEPLPGHEGFAAQIFRIAEKTDADPATGAR